MSLKFNLNTPINTMSYGYVGLNFAKALHKLGAEFSLLPIGNVEVDNKEDYSLVEKLLEPTIKHVQNFKRQNFFPKSPSIRIFHQDSLAETYGNERIGFPIFELDDFTDAEKLNINGCERLMVTSKWAKEIVLTKSGFCGKIGVVPLGVDRSIFNENVSPLLSTDKCTFLVSGKAEKRKCHDIIPRLFCSAFSDKDDVQLLVMIDNVFCSKEEMSKWYNLYKNCPLSNKIRFIDRMDSHKDVASIMASCFCSLSISRAEGWNMELLEMMSMGKHVITTNYAAHTEYANPSNSFLVNITETEDAYDNKWFFGQGKWASFKGPQIEQTISHMRDIYKLWQTNHSNVNNFGIETAKRYSWENSASEFLGFLTNQSK